MEAQNLLNTYSGPDALRKYFDPDCQPMLPLVELPASLNPFYQDGVRIHAKLMSMHPANNVKIMPAMNMLAKGVHSENTKSVVEYSSGSTVISLALASRINHNVHDVRAFLSNKTSRSKIRLMQFFGLDITLFGGPSQPDPRDKRGGIQQAKAMAQKDETMLNPNQYENDANWQSHVKWTGPQIHKQLPSINVLCVGMGTTGTMTGLGQYFKKAEPTVTRLGVCTAAGDRVPGPRSLALLGPVLPWRDSVDFIEEVGSYDAFKLSLQLCREGLICGPSSGFNLQGLLKFLHKRKAAGTLKDLAGPNGHIECAFICCDLPYQYVDEYFDKLGDEAFHPIRNQNLTAVDLYRYDESWELNSVQAFETFVNDGTMMPEVVLLDLRKPDDFALDHIDGSYNLPLQSVNASSCSPFFAADILEAQWNELDTMFTKERISAHELSGKDVYVVCYNGDSARVATSVLRAKGVTANSIKGGMQTLRQELPNLLQSTRGRHTLRSEHKKAANVTTQEIREDSLSPRARARGDLDQVAV